MDVQKGEEDCIAVFYCWVLGTHIRQNLQLKRVASIAVDQENNMAAARLQYNDLFHTCSECVKQGEKGPELSSSDNTVS